MTDKKSVNLRFLLFPHTRLEAGHVSTRVVFTLQKQLTGRIIQQRYIDEITTLQHIFTPISKTRKFGTIYHILLLFKL